MIRSLTVAIAILLVPVVGTTAEPDPAADRFTPMDVFELEWATAPRVSPDGRTIAYVRAGYDVMKDRQVSRIWLIERDGSDHRPLTARDGSGPVWSPSGDRIAFLATTDNGVEIFMHWLDDNRTAHITRLPEAPAGLQFSTDGRWLAFTMFKPEAAEPMVKGPTPPEGAEWAPAFKVFDAVRYRADGQGYLKPGFRHVYLVPSDGGSAGNCTP